MGNSTILETLLFTEVKVKILEGAKAADQVDIFNLQFHSGIFLDCRAAV